MVFTYDGTWSPASCGVSERGTETLTNRFIDKGDGTIYDSVTNLTWLKTGTCFSQQNWDNAIAKSSTLASGQCGLSDGSKAGDWHLPTIDEFRTFFDAEQNQRSLNAVGFSSVQLNYYWSSSSKDINYKWAGTVNGFNVHEYTTINNLYVWPVR
jgi:hypothetical protein